LIANILEPTKNIKSAYELITSQAAGWAALTYMLICFAGMYTISVKNADDKRKASISHYRIHKSNPNPTYYIAENRKFGSLSALVEYYKGVKWVFASC